MSADALDRDLRRHLATSLGLDPSEAGPADWRLALTHVLRDRVAETWLASQAQARTSGAKRVYYLSMEFLIGRLLEDALLNLRMDGDARVVLANLGLDPDTVFGTEADAALGNGGLGRLAACFLDSLSTLGIPAMGYGIRYEHGLFRQSFAADGRQAEAPETWLDHPTPLAFPRPGRDIAVGLGGTATAKGWSPAETLLARAHDVPIIGWENRWANTLRLWEARAPEAFDLTAFNQGDFATAAAPEARARTISRVLYPDDTTQAGQELRLTQEYFFTAAALADIMARMLAEGHAPRDLPKHAAIQLNDTHPAIAGPELVRLLHDVHGMALDEAIATARATLSYTNHTLLPEALERWPEDLMTRLLPRHMQLIERIDAAHAAEAPRRKTTLRADGQVQMGPLSFVMAHKVNGVSALHTELMKETVFADLHALHPKRIVNQTNGVTPRRWLLGCNPRLAALITETIGDAWPADLEQLERLVPSIQDASFLDRFAQIKRANKADLAPRLAEDGDSINPDALFDVQIKRFHEYKRQHLNILETIALWQDIHDSPNADWTPRIKIFAGKAAPGYVFAKEIIHLINNVARVLNTDPVTKGLLRVVYPPNYNVTLAERLIPASDLSEQISTAGKEASGTGNMKFALNGAPTIGTLDGANVEIRERVGAENFFLFGMTAAEVEARRAVAKHASKAIAASPRLTRALATLMDGTFGDTWPMIDDNLRNHDYFTVCSDFDSYWTAQRAVDLAFRDQQAWTAMAAQNTARTGWFSSDRTIQGYARDIWGAAPCPAPNRAAAE